MLTRKIILAIIISVVVFLGLAISPQANALVNDDATLIRNGNIVNVPNVNSLAVPIGLIPGAEIGTLEGKNYKPDEIIVKFKKPVSDSLERQVAGKVKADKMRLSTSLDNLGRKHKVQAIEPVFKDFKTSRERINNLIKKDVKLLTRDEKRMLRRQQRAPKNVAVPELDRIYIIKLEAGQLTEQAVADYCKDPAVEYAELNYIVSICMTPNDSNYPEQWALNNTGQMYPPGGWSYPPGTPGCDINAPEAWNISTGSSEVVVAVIDTGVDYNHRDLQGNIWTDANDHHGYDFANNDNDPMDDHGHGTHCAGIIAANGNNGLDISGVCWDAKIMAVKFLDNYGSGDLTDGADAIRYAVDNGADILSNSWGWGTQTEDTVRAAIQYAVSQGVIVVAAAGNDGISTPFYPAAYDHVISVAATDSDDYRASFSNYGSWVDIAAPGVDILSLRATGTNMGTPYGDKLTVASGTSMACPHVAGACALLLSVEPDLSVDDANTILRDTADTLKDPGTCASGRLDIFKAILKINNPKGFINMDRYSYSCDDTISIFVRDLDLSGNNTCDVNIVCGGDLEIVTLNAISPGIGIFTGAINTDSGSPVTDGVLQVADGQIITTTYYDADDGTGNPATPNSTATADCNCPIISNISFAEELIGPEQIVTFQTNEPTTARIVCGTSCGEANIVTEDNNPQLSHIIKFKGLVPLTNYYFEIEATDLVGNVTVDSNNGNCYWFVTDEGPRDINVPIDFNTIQSAIDAAWNGSTIWLADGNYTGAGNRDIDFRGKAVTLRSVNGPNNCIIDCQGNINNQHRAFIFQNDEELTSVLYGLTMTNGYLLYPNFGSAIYIKYSGPRIEDCVIKNNYAFAGSSVYYYFGEPDFNNCTFTGNSGGNGACVYGGGSSKFTKCIFNHNTASGSSAICTLLNVTIERCTFNENAAHGMGGAVYNALGNLVLNNCAFLNNRTEDVGGAIIIHSGNFVANNCTFANNQGAYGGAIYIYYSTSSITNCSFFGNTADIDGGGIYTGVYSTSNVTNSIIWGNHAGVSGNEVCIFTGPDSFNSASFSYTDINGCGGSGPGWDTDIGTDGWYNIDIDPFFVDPNNPAGPDGMLMTIDDGLELDCNSPCIDMGDNSAISEPNDIAGQKRIFNGVVDMGAYEWSEVNVTPPIITPYGNFMTSKGLGTGPSIPASKTYTLTNDSNAPINWTTSQTQNWVTFSPSSGTLDPNQSVNVTVSINPNSYGLPAGQYINKMAFTDADSNTSHYRYAILTCREETFTEILDTTDTNALLDEFEGHSLTFYPDNSSAFYRLVYQEANAFPTDPNGGTAITLWDKEIVSITGGKVFPFYGTNYNSFYVFWNGSIAFDDTYDWDYSLSDYFVVPRISALYSLLEPWQGNISYKQLFDRIAVTFQNVPEEEHPNNLNSFQIEMFFDGRICITYLNVNLSIPFEPAWVSPAYIGLSRGNGVPNPFFESDLSSYGSTDPRVHNINKNMWYDGIQEAIDDANEGSVIEAVPSIYYEAIDFDGKSITVRSTNQDVLTTIIDGNGATNVVEMNSNATLKGLTITGGQQGVYCFGSTPVISNCIVRNNNGEGIYADSTTVAVKNSVIYDNDDGLVFQNAYGTVRNNTIVNNSSFGIRVTAGNSPAISNCILWNNNDDLNNCSATYSNIEDGDAGMGNISFDPCFVDPYANDFHLDANSECIDKGDPNGSYSNETDIDAQPRVMGQYVDIGADEYLSPCQTCLGDINGDEWIRTYDLYKLRSNLIKANTLTGQYIITTTDRRVAFLWNPCVDIDENGQITLSDYDELTEKLIYAYSLYGFFEYECGDPNIP